MKKLTHSNDEKVNNDVGTLNTIKSKQYLSGSYLMWTDVKWLITMMVIGGLLGWQFGMVSWGLVASLMLYFIWRLFLTQQFYEWFKTSTLTPPTNFSGSLSIIAQQLYANQKKDQNHYRKSMGLINRVRSSLLALQDAVVFLDKKDRLQWWNQSAESMLELKAGDLKKSILDLISVPEFHDYYVNASSPNDGVRMRSWKNSERFLQCEVTHFGNEKLLIIYDVTRLHHLEQMRKDFVSNVSHELRTPLTVLMGYIETFSDQPDLDPKWRKGFGLMSQQTKRMYNIINDLLLLSRLENDEIKQLQRVDMPDLLGDIFDDAQGYNKEYGHFIEMHIDSQKSLYGSEVYLHSALLNLVTNALKYTPKGGEISITWQDEKEGCLFSVSDNGIGIAKEHVERLTERFYRVDSGRSRATGGTGLGLAIVKHVVYQHDAKLLIESEENKGSTFKIFFPKKRVYVDNTSDSKKQ